MAQNDLEDLEGLSNLELLQRLTQGANSAVDQAAPLELADNSSDLSEPIAPAPASLETPAPQAPVQAKLTPESLGYKKDQSGEALKAALDKSREIERMNNLIKAGSDVQAGLASYSGAKPDLSGSNATLDAITAEAQGRAKDVLTKRQASEGEQKFEQEGLKTQNQFADEQQMRSADSLISKNARALAKRMKIIPEEDEKSSYKDLEKVLGFAKKQMGDTSNRYIRLGTSPDGKAVVLDKLTGESKTLDTELADSVLTVKDPITGQVSVLGRRQGNLIKSVGAPKALEQPTEPGKVAEVKLENLTPKQREIRETARHDLLKDETIKHVRQSIGEIDQVNQLVNANIPGTGGATARSLLRMFESGGRFTDQDVQQFKGSQAIGQRAQRSLQEFINGKPFTEEDKKNLSSLNKLLSNANRVKADQASKFYVDDLAQNGIPEKDAKSMITDFIIPGQKALGGKPKMDPKIREAIIKSTMDANPKADRKAVEAALKKQGLIQ